MKKLSAILFVGAMIAFASVMCSFGKEKHITKTEFFGQPELVSAIAFNSPVNTVTALHADAYLIKDVVAGYVSVNTSRIGFKREAVSSAILPGEMRLTLLDNKYPMPINDDKYDNKTCSHSQIWRNLNIDHRLQLV